VPERTYRYTIFKAVQRATCTVTDHFGFGPPAYSWSLNGIPLPESTTSDDTPLTITATVQGGPNSGGMSGEQQVHISYNAGSRTLTIFNADHPGRVQLDIDLHAKEQYVPDDASTIKSRNGALRRCTRSTKTSSTPTSATVRTYCKKILNGLSQQPNPAWQMLGDPSPELVDRTATLSALVHDITLLEKTAPKQAQLLRGALAAKLGLASQSLTAENFIGPSHLISGAREG
jgi:hypothetical protein